MIYQNNKSEWCRKCSICDGEITHRDDERNNRLYDVLTNKNLILQSA
jgi:hypothetical protein